MSSKSWLNFSYATSESRNTPRNPIRRSMPLVPLSEKQRTRFAYHPHPPRKDARAVAEKSNNKPHEKYLRRCRNSMKDLLRLSDRQSCDFRRHSSLTEHTSAESAPRVSKRQSELREFPSGTECSSFSDESCGPRSGHGLRRTSWRTPLYRRCASLESNVFGTEVSLDSGIDIPACSHADGSEDVAPGKSRLETLPSEQICGEHAGATAPCEETRRDMSDGSAQVSDGYPEYELVDVTSDHSSVDLSSHAEPCRRTHWDTFGDWETDNTLYLSFRRDLLSSDAGPSSSNVANLEEAHDFRGIKVDMEESLIMGDMLFECNDLMRDVDEHVATAVSEYWLSDDPLEMPQEWERTHAPVSDDGTNHGECSDFGQIILAPDGDEPPRFKIVKKALGRGKNLVGMGHRAASRARRRLYARIAGLDGEHGY